MDGTNIELLTVQDFAKRAGVTTQWIYKQIRNKGDISKYIIRSNGRIKIDADGLKLYGHSDQSKEPQTETQLVTILREQLRAKDEQIARLQELLQNEQRLHMVAEQRIALLEGDKQEQAENGTPEQENAVKSDPARSGGNTDTEDTAERKPKGLFWRLFGR